MRKFTGKMLDATAATTVLRELGHFASACKSYFARKITGKMPDASDTTTIEHRALTVTVRILQGGHTVWGKNVDVKHNKLS